MDDMIGAKHEQQDFLGEAGTPTAEGATAVGTGIVREALSRTHLGTAGRNAGAAALLQNAKLVFVPCNNKNPAHHWIQIARDPRLGEKTRWMNGNSAKCMDVPNNSDGAIYQQYTCTNDEDWPQQSFVIHLYSVGDP